MTKYIKTGTTEFEQFDGSDEMIGKYDIDPEQIGEGMPMYQLETLEGTMQIFIGDWIATGVNGERWAVEDEVFKRTYTALPKLTKVVAQYLEYCKEHWNLNDAFLNAEYLVSDKDGAVQLDYLSSYPEDFARAWLDGYEVAEVDE